MTNTLIAIWALLFAAAGVSVRAQMFTPDSRRVLNASGDIITEQPGSGGESFDSVTIRLAQPKGQKGGPGTVSVAQLLHKPPARAVKEYRKALKAIAKNDYTDGTSSLENVVGMDPAFLQAQIDLGKCYIQLHKPHEAISTFAQVLKLDPKSATAHAGSALSRLWLADYAAAEDSARQALRIDPTSPVSQFVLGMSLLAQTKSDAEALKRLVEAAKQIPNAHLAAARIYQRQGRSTETRTELEQYLQTGKDTGQRDTVKGWLKSLDEEPAAKP